MYSTVQTGLDVIPSSQNKRLGNLKYRTQMKQKQTLKTPNVYPCNESSKTVSNLSLGPVELALNPRHPGDRGLSDLIPDQHSHLGSLLVQAILDVSHRDVHTS